MEYVKAFAHEGATSRIKISGLKNKVENIEKDRDLWKNRHEGLVQKVSLFLDATKRAPHKVTEFLTDIMRQPPEQDEPQHQRAKTKSREVGR